MEGEGLGSNQSNKARLPSECALNDCRGHRIPNAMPMKEESMHETGHEETITIALSELRRKNGILWGSIRLVMPWAQGDLDKYLPVYEDYLAAQKGSR